MGNLEVKAHSSFEGINMFLFPFIEPIELPKIIYSSDKPITQSSEGIKRKLMECITTKYQKCPQDLDHNQMYDNVLRNIRRAEIRIAV